MKFAEKSCIEFTDELASKAPVPGGGGASALIGAIGIALGSMVGSLTLGKKKYADVEDDIRELMERAEKVRTDMIALIDRDAEVFAPLAAAYGMPKDTPEQAREKEMVMEKVLKDACDVPLGIMRSACEAINIVEGFAQKGSRLAISDAGCAAAACRAALEAASLNVFINTRSMQDRAYADKINAEACSMLDVYLVKAEKIFETVRGGLV